MEMQNRFADRLEPMTYQNDEPWTVALVGAGRPVDWTNSVPDEDQAVPERIVQRILALATAYELHQLSSLGPNGQNRLNSQQSASLADELHFLLQQINDPALHVFAGPLQRLAARCARDARLELLVEGP
jgi:hypothetical protein